MLKMREQLRSENRLKESDGIRSYLQFQGYLVEDQVEGLPIWYKSEV